MNRTWTARKYRHVAEYQEPEELPDAHGQLIQTWSTLATHRCEARALTGREALVAGQFAATLTTAIVHRFIAESNVNRPKPTGRYKIGDRLLYVSEVSDPTGERRELKALCAENASA